MEVKLLSEKSEFQDLRDSWDQLVQHAVRPSCFSTWNWLHTWWEIYSTADMLLQIHCYYQDCRLVALLPLYLSGKKKFSTRHYRNLKFIGTGEPEDEETSTEYSDIICADGYEEDLIEFIVQNPISPDYIWHTFELDKVLHDSLILDAMSNPGFSLPHIKELAGRQYFLEIHPVSAEVQQGFTSSLRKNLAYNLKRIDRSDDFEFVLIDQDDQIDQVMDALEELHSKRWSEKGQTGAFTSARFRRFHRIQTKLLLHDKALFLLKLSYQGEVVAVLYAMCFKGVMYYYQSGYAHTRFKSYSLGHCMVMKAIEYAIERGLNRFDFMMGRLESYKSQFGCETKDMFNVRVFNSNRFDNISYLLSSCRIRLKQRLYSNHRYQKTSRP